MESLLVGNCDTAGNLIFAGNVDFGLTGKRTQILPMLELLAAAKCPCADLKLPRAMWVQPKLAARVKSIGLNRGVLREGTLIELSVL